MDGISSVRNVASPTTQSVRTKTDWSKPLLETLSKLDPDKAAPLIAQVRETQGIVYRIQSSSGSFSGAQAAEQRVGWIKSRLEQLQSDETGSARVRAREYKQLSRDLADAVKVYAASGGETASTGTLPTVADIVAAAKAALAKPGDKDARTALDKTIDGTGQQSGFAQDVFSARNTLRKLIGQTRDNLPSYSFSRLDLRDAEKALRETDAMLTVTSPAKQSSGVNFLA